MLLFMYAEVEYVKMHVLGLRTQRKLNVEKSYANLMYCCLAVSV